MSDVNVQEDKFYTLAEVVDAVKKTLDVVGELSEQHNELRYSSTDVYWLLYDMLQYVNRNVPGEFGLRQTQKGHYRVRYMAEDTAKQKSSSRLKADVDRTAQYLKKLRGACPPWGQKEQKS